MQKLHAIKKGVCTPFFILHSACTEVHAGRSSRSVACFDLNQRCIRLRRQRLAFTRNMHWCHDLGSGFLCCTQFGRIGAGQGQTGSRQHCIEVRALLNRRRCCDHWCCRNCWCWCCFCCCDCYRCLSSDDDCRRYWCWHWRRFCNRCWCSYFRQQADLLRYHGDNHCRCGRCFHWRWRYHWCRYDWRCDWCNNCADGCFSFCCYWCCGDNSFLDRCHRCRCNGCYWRIDNDGCCVLLSLRLQRLFSYIIFASFSVDVVTWFAITTVTVATATTTTTTRFATIFCCAFDLIAGHLLSFRRFTIDSDGAGCQCGFQWQCFVRLWQLLAFFAGSARLTRFTWFALFARLTLFLGFAWFTVFTWFTRLAWFFWLAWFTRLTCFVAIFTRFARFLGFARWPRWTCRFAFILLLAAVFTCRRDACRRCAIAFFALVTITTVAVAAITVAAAVGQFAFLCGLGF